jgi:hypothetical protein
MTLRRKEVGLEAEALITEAQGHRLPHENDLEDDRHKEKRRLYEQEVEEEEMRSNSITMNRGR